MRPQIMAGRSIGPVGFLVTRRGGLVVRTLLSFCDGLPERLFAPNEVLLAEDGEDRALYILIEGELEVLKGDVHINYQSEPGVIFGELSVLLEIPHTATVRAVVPTRVHVIENATEFLSSHKEISFQIARLLGKKLHSVTTYLADLKRQFSDQDDHLGMVDEVLKSLIYEPVDEYDIGSERYPDRAI